MSFHIEGIRPEFHELKLRKNISTPSTIHGYSLAIEYMRNWILSKFPDNFFKTVHVNGKHVLADYRKFKEEKLHQIIKPAIAIIPILNIDYNRENIDLVQGPMRMFTIRSKFKNNRFLEDYDNNVFIEMQMKQIEMIFNFKIRVKSRAQQLDLLEYTRLACRIGSTQSENLDIDCHVPYDIILAVAIDNGFELITDDNGFTHIYDIVSFLKYLNSHSYLQFTYKFRTINGKSEFFIRIPNCYINISNLEGISIDDGERQGSLDDNFHIEFTSTLKFPVPSFFVYYSYGDHRIIGKEQKDINALYQIVTTGPPDIDEHNWRQYLTTQWIDDSKDVKQIYFRELLENNNLQKVISYNISIGLSPAIFMNIKIYNGQKEIPINIDWKNYIININQDKLIDEVSDIAIYADLNYINDTISNIENIENNRIKVSS